MQTKAMFTGLFLQTNVEDLSYGLMTPARLKYFSDKNNNNKLSSTQKINCVQQGDRRVHSSHCTTGLHRKGQTGRTPTEWSRGPGPAFVPRQVVALAVPSAGTGLSSPHVRLVFCFLVCLFMSSGPLLSEDTWPSALTPWRRLVSCSSKGMSWKERDHETPGSVEWWPGYFTPNVLLVLLLSGAAPGLSLRIRNDVTGANNPQRRHKGSQDSCLVPSVTSVTLNTLPVVYLLTPALSWL